MSLREALVTIAETVLGVVTTDRALGLRRLIFDEARRSPDVGQHYYQIGPERALAAIEGVFRSHGAQTDFDLPMLAHHFLAMISWGTILERECCVRAAPTRADMRARVEPIVDDFMKAFLKGQ